MILNICQNLIVIALNEILCVYIHETQILDPGDSFMHSPNGYLVEVKPDFLCIVPSSEVLLADGMAGSDASVL